MHFLPLLWSNKYNSKEVESISHQISKEQIYKAS